MNRKINFVKSSLSIKRTPFTVSGDINGLPFKFNSVSNSNYPIKFFSMSNNRKPDKYSIYTKDEQRDKNLTYRFVSIYGTNEKQNKIIVASAELYIGPSCIEIYNMYTKEDYKGTGVTSMFIKLIKTLYTDSDLWIRITYKQNELNTEPFRKKIDFYAKAGFTSEVKVTNTSEFGKKFKYNFIQMKYKHRKIQTSSNVRKKTVNKATTIVRSTLKSNFIHRSLGAESRHRLYNVKFHITSKYLKKVQSVLSHTKEYGGAIKFSYNGFKYDLFTFVSENDVTKYETGTEHNFTTNIPDTNILNTYLIRWHTHPSICLLKHSMCVTLPSPPDIANYIGYYINGRDKTGINLIFAHEGLYVITFKSTFITFVEKQRQLRENIEINWKYIEAFVNNIWKTQLITNKNKIYTNDDKRIIIENYKRQLETLEINGIKIFKMDLIPYPTLSSRGIDINTKLHSDTIYTSKKSLFRTPRRPYL